MPNTKVINRTLQVVGIILVLVAVGSGTAGGIEITLFWGGIVVTVWGASRERRRKQHA